MPEAASRMKDMKRTTNWLPTVAIRCSMNVKSVLLLGFVISQQLLALEIDPTTRQHSANDPGDFSGAITVNPPTGWTATVVPEFIGDDVSWVSITHAPGFLVYAMNENFAAETRNALIDFGEAVQFKLVQSGRGATLSANSFSFDQAGGTDTLNVTVLPGTTWRTSGAASWIRILSGPTGFGSGVVTFEVDPHTDVLPREGNFMVAGQVVRVSQTGIDLTIEPSQAVVTDQLNLISFNVTALQSQTWSPVPNVPWVNVLSPGHGFGNGTVTLTVQPNGSYLTRQGQVHVGSKTFLVNQAGNQNLSISISPLSSTSPREGASGAVNVLVSPDTPWAAESSATWLQLVAGAKGTNNGAVSFVVSPNNSLAEREAIVEVAAADPLPAPDLRRGLALHLIFESASPGDNLITAQSDRAELEAFARAEGRNGGQGLRFSEANSWQIGMLDQQTVSFWFAVDYATRMGTVATISGHHLGVSADSRFVVDDLPSDVEVESNRWYQVIVRRSGSLVDVFLDGVLLSQFGDSVDDLTFNPTGGFLGRLDDFRSYHRALDDAEIFSLHNDEVAGDGLVVYQPSSSAQQGGFPLVGRLRPDVNTIDEASGRQWTEHFHSSFDPPFEMANNVSMGPGVGNYPGWHFSGSESYLADTDPRLNIGGDYTITFWFMTADADRRDQAFLGTFPHTGLGISYNWMGNRRVEFALGQPNVGWTDTHFQGNKTNYVSGRWYKLELEKHGTIYRLRIDDRVDAQHDVPEAAAYTGTVGYMLGSPTAGGGGWLRGALSDVTFNGLPVLLTPPRRMALSASGLQFDNGASVALRFRGIGDLVSWGPLRLRADDSSSLALSTDSGVTFFGWPLPFDLVRRVHTALLSISNGSEASVYLDGEFLFSQPTTHQIVSSASGELMVHLAEDGEIRVYGRPLTAQEARTVSQAIAPDVQYFTLIQEAAVPQLTKSTETVLAPGATIQTELEVPTGVPWTASSVLPWLQFVKSDASLSATLSGTGPATISVFVEANNSTEGRQGVVTIAGLTFEVTQLGRTVTLNPLSSGMTTYGGNVSAVIRESGGALLLGVLPEAGTSWTIDYANAADASWITPNPASGTGNDDVLFAVSQYNSPLAFRTAVFYIGSKEFRVTQRGYTAAVTPTAGAFPADGGDGTIDVTVPPSALWEAVSLSPWITIITGQTANGSGVVTYKVGSNKGPDRFGTIIVAGQAIQVTQAEVPVVTEPLSIVLSGTTLHLYGQQGISIQVERSTDLSTWEQFSQAVGQGMSAPALVTIQVEQGTSMFYRAKSGQ